MCPCQALHTGDPIPPLDVSRMPAASSHTHRTQGCLRLTFCSPPPASRSDPPSIASGARDASRFLPDTRGERRLRCLGTPLASRTPTRSAPHAPVLHSGATFGPLPPSDAHITPRPSILSLLLFILAMEPLAKAVRSHSDITGIKVAGSVHKISLFADDILMTLISPRISLPNLLSLLETFAYFFRTSCYR